MLFGSQQKNLAHKSDPEAPALLNLKAVATEECEEVGLNDQPGSVTLRHS